MTVLRLAVAGAFVRFACASTPPNEPDLSCPISYRIAGRAATGTSSALREARIAEDVTIGAEIERIPIVALQRYGRRLSALLDRPRQKRCDFQIVEKAYKNPDPQGPATFEQIFWFTQTPRRGVFACVFALVKVRSRCAPKGAQ